MAAIAGILKQQQQESVEQMIQSLRHRGEDQCEIRQVGDLSAGVCSPSLSAERGNGLAEKDGTVVLLDGEIYNARPEGQSDADVILDLYRQHGRTFAGHLHGVFACAIYDNGELLLARDAVGVRPLYWGLAADGTLCFASEVKALVGRVESVHDLLPATSYSSRSGLAGYVVHYPDVTIPAEFEPAVAEVRKTMTAAVQRRLDDGAVGACLLSGGLDSSIIACVAAERGATDLPLITVGMDGASDVENAKIVAEHLGMEHHIHSYEPADIAELVPRAVRTLESFDEDCVSGTISNLFASGKAREFTNCILSGEGGDELFGGYHLLKDLPTEAGRLKMMHRLVEVAYNTALQRLDRAMMGNGITYRTPFIDTNVIALALQLPIRWKIHDSGQGKWIEKHILREAFKDILPDAIYRRVKLRFAAGTGTDDLMDQLAGEAMDVAELTEETRNTPGGYRLNSPKELWYYNIFKADFPDLQFEKLVGRWDPGK
ncbi:MAG: hypothetical protein GVY16_09490 [Planctomycetes bacterium]|nr:hypothetical protein [Planctomycetota bacterium]